MAHNGSSTLYMTTCKTKAQKMSAICYIVLPFNFLCPHKIYAEYRPRTSQLGGGLLIVVSGRFVTRMMIRVMHLGCVVLDEVYPPVPWVLLTRASWKDLVFLPILLASVAWADWCDRLFLGCCGSPE